MSDSQLQRSPGQVLERLRGKAPLVQCLQTPVSMDITANVLLAVGSSPAMVCAAEETAEFMRKADALTVNMGSLNPARVLEVQAGMRFANEFQKPWVLDPVACGSTTYRTEGCVKALDYKPTVIRGNASEILALSLASSTKSEERKSFGRGADATDTTDEALPAAVALARRQGCVVAISGSVDRITDGRIVVEIRNGVALMTKITGVGCSLSALVACCVASEPSCVLEATCAAFVLLGVSAEISRAQDPGNLRVRMMENLYNMEASFLDRSAQIKFYKVDDMPQSVDNPMPMSNLLASLQSEIQRCFSHRMMAYLLFNEAVEKDLEILMTVMQTVLNQLPSFHGNGQISETDCLHWLKVIPTWNSVVEKTNAYSAYAASLLLCSLAHTCISFCNFLQENSASQKLQSKNLESFKSIRDMQGELLKQGEQTLPSRHGLNERDCIEYCKAGANIFLSMLNHFSSSTISLEHQEKFDLLLKSKLAGVPVRSPKIPRVLIIAGSDSGGGAGIQADIKACQALGAYSMTAIAALTAQNTRGVAAVEPVAPSFLRKQIEVCLEDIGADVVKTGMLASASVVEAAVSAVGRRGIVKWVVDPVMVATSGDKLVNAEAIDKIKKLLFPLAEIITPNLPEAMALLDRKIAGTAEDMLVAARDLALLGPSWVMVKGGHVEGSQVIPDVLYCRSSGESHVFPAWKVHSENTHGTGCSLASSIAAGLAQGMSMVEAVTRAKMFVWDAIRASSSLTIGSGHGPLHHAFQSVCWHDQHSMTYAMRQADTPPGQSIQHGRLIDYSLYAVTDDSCVAAQGMDLAHAVSQAIEGGASIIQLRQKDVDSRKMLETAKQLMAICRAANVPFIVNDRVDIALACDADGVHVGQDDMPCREVRRLLGPHKIVGVSVKTAVEAIKAQEDGADYVGSGAVYPTSTKDSSSIGVEGLRKVS
eukprot:768366-Hanusia_phi.AAC.3